MHEFVFFNGENVSARDISISALSSATLYGKGIFTTVGICESQPFLWEKHWRRLTGDAAKVRIGFSEYSENAALDALEKLVSANEVDNGRARITLYDESPGTIWPFETARKTSLLITTADPRAGSNNFRVTVSPYAINSLSPLSSVKSCNYLEHLIALDEAKTRGFDEAIQINQRGEIASAVLANVFWLKDEVLYTPSLKTGCLPGTTREFVSENLECREMEATMDELSEADAVFLTSAGLGVVQVGEFESRKLEKSGHPILDLLPEKA